MGKGGTLGYGTEACQHEGQAPERVADHLCIHWRKISAFSLTMKLLATLLHNLSNIAPHAGEIEGEPLVLFGNENAG
jgi:hypothetical protein